MVITDVCAIGLQVAASSIKTFTMIHKYIRNANTHVAAPVGRSPCTAKGNVIGIAQNVVIEETKHSNLSIETFFIDTVRFVDCESCPIIHFLASTQKIFLHLRFHLYM